MRHRRFGAVAVAVCAVCACANDDVAAPASSYTQTPIDVGATAELTALASSDDAVYAVGSSSRVLGPMEDIFVARLTAHHLDTAFSDDGVAIVEAAFRPDRVLVQDDGRVVILGATNDFGRGPSTVEIVRLSGSGEVDRSFGDAGMASVVFDDQRSQDAEPELLSASFVDGRILMAANSTTGGVVLMSVLRDGSLDNTFGDGGMTTVELENGDDAADFASAGHNSSGEVIVALMVGDTTQLISCSAVGSCRSTSELAERAELAAYIEDDVYLLSSTTSGGFALRRYRDDGRRDEAFGDSGELVDTDPVDPPVVSASSDGTVYVLEAFRDAGGRVIHVRPGASPDSLELPNDTTLADMTLAADGELAVGGSARNERDGTTPTLIWLSLAGGPP